MVQTHVGPAVTAAAIAATAAVLLLHARSRRRRAVVQQVELVQLNLRELPKDSVPAELRVETYVDLDKAASRGYAHVDYLRASFDVCAVLDGLHAYTVDYLQRAIGERDPGAAMLTLYITKKGRLIRADTYGPAGASAGGEWATQGCSGRVVIEVGARFHPERLIGGTEAASPGAPEATLYVCSGALVQGGVFDLSCGSIWLGAGALVEPGVLVRGPAVVGAGTVLRHGAYIRGDVVLGAHGVFGGELKLTLTPSLTLTLTLALTLTLTTDPCPSQASSRASSRSTMPSCRTRAMCKTAAQRLRPIHPPARSASGRSSSGRPPASASLGQLAELFWLAGHTRLAFHTGTRATAATRCLATARTSAAARSRPTSRSSPARGRRSRCVARGTTSAAASWARCWATTASSAAAASRSRAACSRPTRTRTRSRGCLAASTARASCSSLGRA